MHPRPGMAAHPEQALGQMAGDVAVTLTDNAPLQSDACRERCSLCAEYAEPDRHWSQCCKARFPTHVQHICETCLTEQRAHLRPTDGADSSPPSTDSQPTDGAEQRYEFFGGPFACHCRCDCPTDISDLADTSQSADQLRRCETCSREVCMSRCWGNHVHTICHWCEAWELGIPRPGPRAPSQELWGSQTETPTTPSAPIGNSASSSSNAVPPPHSQSRRVLTLERF